jgi:hypothetical protein
MTEEIRGLEGFVTGRSKHPRAFTFPGHTIAEGIAGVDAFCALKMGYGDRVTFERVQIGAAVAWIFNLDNAEIGRFSIAPSRKSFSCNEKYTANSRSAAGTKDPGEKHGILLCYQIMDDLDDHLHEYLGHREPTDGLRPLRPKFWSEPGPVAQKIAKPENEGGSDQGEPEKAGKRERGPNDETDILFEELQKIVGDNSEGVYTQITAAEKYNEVNPDRPPINEHNVRNAYRSKGKQWLRGKRSRRH